VSAAGYVSGGRIPSPAVQDEDPPEPDPVSVIPDRRSAYTSVCLTSSPIDKRRETGDGIPYEKLPPDFVSAQL